ncbi:MAG TPA: DUF2147 domain-containing protein [Bradyrhizobium sp.]|nr:DUF2147 domain-containing protein [Bradyrhizobium sp.]
MKTLFAIAAFLMASTAAQAQYTFEYDGKTIRIDPDRGTISIPGVYDNTGRRGKRSRNDQDATRKQTPEQAKADPQAQAPPAPAPAPAAAEPVAPPAPPITAAKTAPADTAVSDQPVQPAQPQVAGPSPPPPQDPVPAAKPVPPPVVATAPPPAPTPATPAAQQANSPLGLWLTEEKEGRVRIEQCGANLCGYSVDQKSNQNGEQVLINMKPGKDSKWSGRILDPKTGSTYDSTIALKGTDTLRVQGCAFGGMFCGGQTWSRLN